MTGKSMWEYVYPVRRERCVEGFEMRRGGWDAIINVGDEQGRYRDRRESVDQTLSLMIIGEQ